MKTLTLPMTPAQHRAVNRYWRERGYGVAMMAQPITPKTAESKRAEFKIWTITWDEYAAYADARLTEHNENHPSTTT